MHVGHCRGAVFGDALASLLQFAGYDVTREYYINDAGAQVDVLARSAFLRYREALGEDIGAIPEGLYPGDYLKPVGAGAGRRAWRRTLKQMPEARMAADRARQGHRHDDGRDPRRSRRAEHSPRRVLLRTLAAGRATAARSPPPSMACASAASSTKAACRRRRAPSTTTGRTASRRCFARPHFGDDVDRPLLKSDGSYTYFASDIAYHSSKFDRGFANMIDVWGADHGGYIKRMQAAVKAVTDGKGDLDVKIVQLVRLLRDGEPVKMSKRSGDFVTLREVVDEVGRDAVRFMMLYRKNDAVLDFDLAKVIEQSRDNPVFYVQYGHARGALDFPQRAGGVSGRAGGCRRRALAWLAGADLARLTDAGGTRPPAPARAVPAAGRKRRARPTSRTGWLSISMILPANFTRFGRGGGMRLIYASLSRMMQR